MTRCLAFLLTEHYLLPIHTPPEHLSLYQETILFTIRSVFVASAALWAVVSLVEIAKLNIQIKQNLFKTIKLSEKYIKVQ